ncbi:MAG: histidine phosphatase family protein [Hyphomicrobiales bacterium]|nr:histidine phosphatase family protein [Hyphomicrobiales bacterium]
MTARLILICHASTDAVRRPAFPADEALDDIGRRDAAAAAQSLSHADRNWVSPELRTRQTAQELGLDAAVQPSLCDCDYGAWRGRKLDDVQAREPDAMAAWLRDPAAAPHGGESILAVIQRVAAWLAGEHGHHRQSIVVTHATIIRAAIVHAIGATPQSFRRIDIAPLSVTRLSGTHERWNLVTANCPLNGST